MEIVASPTPTTKDGHTLATRSIFIGDVHGCAEELVDLLSTVEHAPSDRVFFVGDLVARGPDSRRVLQIYRSVGARGVLGNHEDRLLESRAARRAGQPGPHLGASHAHLMDQLDDEDWELLEALPLTLDVPEHRIRIVHAGLVPGVPLERQERHHLLKMRALESDGTPTSKWRPRSWAEHYSGEPHVIFGHNAVSGLQLHPSATGLDTGCVYGGRLTALVLAEHQLVPEVAERPRHLVSVPARRRYVDFGPRYEAEGKAGAE